MKRKQYLIHTIFNSYKESLEELTKKFVVNALFFFQFLSKYSIQSMLVDTLPKCKKYLNFLPNIDNSFIWSIKGQLSPIV